MVLLGASVAALFANDGAALILTPIVMAMLLALGFIRGHACVRDGGRLHRRCCQPPLSRFQPGQYRFSRFFQDRLQGYAAIMIPVNIVAIAAALAVLLLYFRQSIPARYDVHQLKRPNDAIRDGTTFRTGWLVLVLLLVGFFGLEPLGVPISAVAAAGALLLFAVAARGHVISTRKVLREAPWQIVIFSLGMYLVVYGLRNEGLTDYLTVYLIILHRGGYGELRSEPAFLPRCCLQS